MRIKKKNIKEGFNDDVNTVANTKVQDTKDAITTATNTFTAAGIEDEPATELATDIVQDVISTKDYKVSEGDDAVSRGIEYGVNPEVDQEDLGNDGDGQRGGPDYGQEKKKKSTSLRGADYNDADLPFESVTETTEVTNNELAMHISNLSNEIKSTKNPKKIELLKKDLEDTKNKLASRKINENVNPKMTKKQLAEAVLGKRKVINTFKVKDLRNE